MKELILDIFNTSSENLSYIQNLIVDSFDVIVNVIFYTILIVVLTKIAIFIFNKILTKAMLTRGASKKRVETIIGITDNLIKYLMGIILLIVILVSFGVPWESLIAGAGVLGIVLGLGAQELISDTVNGFFVIFEGTYEFGDYIKVNQFEGYVTYLGIKSTIITSNENEKITIPNSKIQEVVNLSKNNYVLYYNFDVSYDIELNEINKIIEQKIVPKMQKIEGLIEAEYIGLDEFKESSIAYCLRLTMLPESRFKIKRQINAIIKEVFDNNNIEIPYKNITISYKKENNNVKEME